MSWLRRRPSPALIVAFLALAVALGGTSFASDTVARISAAINGKKIKKNSLPANRIKKNTVTGTQVRESKLGKVRQATQADNAARLGLTPAAGYQTFSERSIPSGTTVTGAFGLQHFFSASGASQDHLREAVSLPGPAPTALDDSDVNFANGTAPVDDDATCTGTPDAPTAPPGKACLYLLASGGLTTEVQGEGMPTSGGSRYGFVIRSDNDGGAGTGVYGTWAYTAP